MAQSQPVQSQPVQSQPVLALADAKVPRSTTANLLPCRINHDGPTTIPKNHWSPSASDSTGTRTAYFRGRKLVGTTVQLPNDYRGVVVEREREPSEPAAAETDTDTATETATGQMTVSGVFDNVVIWGHEAVVDGQADPYTRSINEWVELASEIHCPTTDQ